jgi:3-dehydroquinate synthase
MASGKLVFTQDIGNTLQEYYAKFKYENLIFIVDSHTKKYCWPLFKTLSANLIEIEAGELHKNLTTYSFILEKLMAFKAGNDTLVVNLGGGVITDIGGFAASTYRRGIPFINIPTTLMGMADAAIGGKNGIDFKFKKNYLGTFVLPNRVFISTQFLNSLPKKEFESGLAEIIKTGIIANKKLFKAIEKNEPIEALIHQCAHTKNTIVKKDFKDNSIRQLLNFGHTIGHAYESYRLSIGKPILHGFAIAKGILAESKIAYSMGKISHMEYMRITKVVSILTHQKPLTEDEFLKLKKWLKSDKKNKNNNIVFSLPESIGKGSIQNEIAEATLHKLIF